MDGLSLHKYGTDNHGPSTSPSRCVFAIVISSDSQFIDLKSPVNPLNFPVPTFPFLRPDIFRRRLKEQITLMFQFRRISSFSNPISECCVWTKPFRQVIPLLHVHTCLHRVWFSSGVMMLGVSSENFQTREKYGSYFVLLRSKMFRWTLSWWWSLYFYCAYTQRRMWKIHSTTFIHCKFCVKTYVCVWLLG